ncbi:unnamed protein product, partial [Iphiclides podalirius]
MGTSRQFITIDQQVAGAGVSQGARSALRRSTETHPDTRGAIVKTGTHTSDTRESLRLDGIISASISVSRTIGNASRSRALPRYGGVPFPFGSFMTVDLNGIRCMRFLGVGFPFHAEVCTGERVAATRRRLSGSVFRSARQIERRATIH